MMKTILISGLLILSQVACVRLVSNKDGGPGNSDPVQTEDAKFDNSLPAAGEAKLFVGANPSEFQVMVGWTANCNRLKRVDLSVKNDLGTVIERAGNDTGSVFYDKEILEKHTYSYQFLSNEPTPRVLGQTSAVEVPFDILLKVDTFQNIVFDWTDVPFRIFIPENFIGLTNGRDLEIKAKYIIFSNNSILETFKDGTEASEGSVGLSGGKLILDADKIVGSPIINMRGMNGGKGQDGAYMVRAATGEGGKSARKNCELEEIGGPPGRGHMMSISPLGRQHCYCEAPAEPGKPGANGVDGNPGLAGQKGGDSGYLLIRGKDLKEFKPQVNISAGLGGFGGAGGRGQLGGLGGTGGVGFQNCPSQGNGPEGQPGNPGPSGSNGASGITSPWCIEAEGSLNCRS